VIALVGLVTSLFFGEMLHYEPCRLCWYQRICLFPLALLLGIGAYRDDERIIPYAIPLCILGAALAFYQVLGIFFPQTSTTALCGYNAHCSEGVPSLWGFLSFPLLSLLAFLAMLFFLWFHKKES